MIKIADFTNAIKVSWIKRYTVDKIDDNWADMIDNYLDLTPDTRHKIHQYGPERFNNIIKEDIPVISSLFTAYKAFKQHFPTKPETLDNTWINQCAFFNTNINRKQPNSKQTTFLRPTFYGIPDTYHTLTLKDLYPAGTFITNEGLNTLTNSTILNMHYNNLKNHIKSHIGPNKKYDAIAKERLPQRKNTFSNTTDFMKSIHKGSGLYRRVLGRGTPLPDIHNPKKWRKRLDDQNLTRIQVKKSMIHLHSPYIDSTSADHLSRLKLGKTLFNAQLFNIGLNDDKNCKTCLREFDQHTPEDYKHAMYLCPAVQTVVNNVTTTFFPNKRTPFSISEVLVAVNSDMHNLYRGQIGHELASLIWDLLQTYIIKCHTAVSTPISATAIFEIRAQLNRVLKILPKSKITCLINSTPQLNTIITSRN